LGSTLKKGVGRIQGEGMLLTQTKFWKIEQGVQVRGAHSHVHSFYDVFVT